MPFLLDRRIFPSILCAESLRLLLERLAWRSFFRTNFPSWLTRGKTPNSQGEGKPTSKHLFHHVFSVGEISEPMFVWKIPGLLLGLILCMNLDTGTSWQNSHFLSVGPKMVWPKNILKIGPFCCFHSFSSNSFVLLLGFLKQAGGSLLLAT